MPRYFYLGHSVNLGRFGWVKRGDVVNLTEKEEESILSDTENSPRFKVFKEGEKIEGVGLDVPAVFPSLSAKDQANLLRKLADDKRRRDEGHAGAVNPASGTPEAEPEAVRRQRLEAANADTDRARWTDATRAELMTEVERIMRDEKVRFPDIKPTSTRISILKALLGHKGLSDEGLEDDEEPK